MARPRTKTLTATHRKIAHTIAAVERSGFAAGLSELVERLGLARSSSLMPTLRIMERNGYVLVSGGGRHGRDQLIKLSPKGRLAIQEGVLPVYGCIQAGTLHEAVEETDRYFEEHDLLPHQSGDFLLEVRGDSMVGDGILPGDFVLLRPGVTPRQGEIVAALVGEEEGDYAGGAPEATLKRFYKEGRTVCLKASNPAYPDKVLPARAVKVAGVFKGLIRHGDCAR